MENIASNTQRMNTVGGKVNLKESGVGIPEILVIIYDLDPNTKPEELMHGSENLTYAALGQVGIGDRIGSAPTDAEGRFEIRYEDSEFQIRNEQEKRPDLLLMVMAPETPGGDAGSSILYVSKDIRQNAGRNEYYLVQLTADQLKAAGIPVPSSPSGIPEEPEEVINRLVAVEEKRLKFEEGIKEKIERVHIEKFRKLSASFEQKMKPKLIEALSGVPNELRESATFVAEGQSVKEKTFKTIKMGLKVINNERDAPVKRAPIKGYISLTPEQIEALENLTDENGDSYKDGHGNFVNVPAEEVDTIIMEGRRLGGDVASDHSDILRDDPIAKYCIRQTLDDVCQGQEADTEDGGETATGEGTALPEATITEATGNGLVVATGEDVPRYIATLMDTLKSPEVSPELRPDRDVIQGNIDHFSLNSGPADTPAFYDFHNLQIAFEHVWQEAIDKGILDLAEDAYREIVELGGNPNLEGDDKDPLGAMNRENQNIMYLFGIPGIGTVLDKLEDIAERVVDEIFGNGDEGDQTIRDHRDGAGTEVVPSRFGKGAKHATRDHRDKLRLPEILAELKKRVAEDCAFTVYAANKKERSVNFGVVVMYRQKWEPQNYQVGELVKTVTLMPKEARKFSRKTVVKKKRSKREVEKNLISRKEEASETSRVEEQIISKAEAKTNFNLTANGSYNAVAWQGSASTSLTKDAETRSEDIKKAFREAVFKSAQEYKQERSLEVSTEESFEEEFTESGEIMNPNDELAVTFLFYELQRRYKVTERIHRLRHVVLVAQEVPNPGDIDEDWLIAHDWILNRVLLDDSFRPALVYLSTRLVGDEFALEELRKNVDQQRRIVEALKDELVAVHRQAGRRYAALEQAIERRAREVATESSEGLFENTLEFLTGSDQSPEAARIREDAARDAYERALREERDMRSGLEREVTALEAATEQYTKMLSEHLNQKTQVARLQVHVKQNILYYMQAIWAHEPPDQRFFRLHKVQVPIFEEKSKKITIGGAAAVASGIFDLRWDTETRGVTVDTTIEEPAADFETASLAEVADLDDLLGFKGNYLIFPLKKPNPLTEFMAEPYINRATGELIDPDLLGNINLDEFAEYVCCLKSNVSAKRFAELRPALEELLRVLLNSPLRNREDLIVPTDSLYIEALPAKHPILEDFKLMHRAIDVKKVQAEVRQAELENIRAAARLIADDYEDPDIEKKIVIEGNSQNVIVPPGDE